MTKILHPGCDHCNHPMFAAMRCDVCGKVHSTDDEPQQEVVGPEEEAAIDAAAKGGVVIYSDAESSVPEGWKHEIDDLRKRATCGCGDMFTEHDPGTCGNCVAAMKESRAASRQQIERLVEALKRAERKLSAYVGVCTGDKELTNTILPMAREALAAVERERGNGGSEPRR